MDDTNRRRKHFPIGPDSEITGWLNKANEIDIMSTIGYLKDERREQLQLICQRVHQMINYDAYTDESPPVDGKVEADDDDPKFEGTRSPQAAKYEDLSEGYPGTGTGKRDTKQRLCPMPAPTTAPTPLKVADDLPEWRTLLREWKLQRFEEAFEREGYDSVAFWPYITDRELADIKMKLAHVRYFKAQTDRLVVTRRLPTL